LEEVVDKQCNEQCEPERNADPMYKTRIFSNGSQENVTTCRADNRKEFLRKLLYKTLVKKTHLEDNLSRAATGDSFRQILIWQSFMPTLLSKEPAEASERKIRKNIENIFQINVFV